MILAETTDWIAFDKPAGVSMATSGQPGRSGTDAVRRLLAACGETGREGLLLVHRLDEGTSGVVLLARSEEAHRALSLSFQTRAARKTYRGLVWGHPRPSEGAWDDSLGRDPSDGRRMKVRTGGKPARTRYRTLSRLPSVADLVLSPETGRTHQIRVHLSAHGHPIVGDDLYGGAARWRGVRIRSHRQALAAVRRPLLHAERIQIPDLGIDVKSPLPQDYAGALEVLSHAPSERVRDKLPPPSFRR
jgi:23S rRNA pseudouridine1911/1915/1917 synthase